MHTPRVPSSIGANFWSGAAHAPIEEGHISCTLVHLANASYRLGRTLNFDPQTEQVIDDREANRLLRDADRGYRRPFQIPEHV